ncbi:MAG: helix-turn-helix transcriptional regulator [Treponemataceae bacterium]
MTVELESYRLLARSLYIGCKVGIVSLMAASNGEFETPGFSGNVPNEISEELSNIFRRIGTLKDQIERDSLIVKVVGLKGRSWLALRLGSTWTEGWVLLAGPFAKIECARDDIPPVTAAADAFPASGEDRFFFVGQIAVFTLHGVSARFPLVPITLFLAPAVGGSGAVFAQKKDDTSEVLLGDVSKKIRDCVRSGDVEGLKRALQSDVTLLPGKVDPGETYRFYREKYLTSCGTCSEIALESGLDYEKVMSLTNKYIFLVNRADDLGTLGYLAFRLFEEFTWEISYFLEAKNSIKVRKMISYIEGFMAKPICLGDMASAVGLSPSYATALLKTETGRSFSETLREIRIKKAKKLLRNTDLSIRAVATATGFSLPNNFSKIFRETTGTNPSEFRKNLSKI